MSDPAPIDAAAADVAAAPAPEAPKEPRWGRVLIAGGTDWPRLGKKDKPKPDEEITAPDLLEPHILRSLSNVRITSVHASCASHAYGALDDTGRAWLFGRNASGALGVPSKVADAVSESAPARVTARELSGGRKGTKIVDIAFGRAHTLLVGSEGQVWSAGANALGQCGHSPCAEVSSFKPVDGPWSTGPADERDHAVHAAAGISFSLVLTARGRVFAFGSGEHGQLGHGRTGEHIVTAGKTAFDLRSEPVLVRGLEGKKITQIACGQQHSVALDDTGVVYVWGYNGYCRLGLGNQVDALVPKVVPQFSGPREITMGRFIVAGPSCTVVVDNQKMYWLAGKWKNTGDGSGGQPYSTFRYMQDIMACKISHAACGGVTLFALTPDDVGGVMTIAWGQNAASGELGLGADEPKSATKPTRHMPLAGIEVLAVAAGQSSTLFLVAPDSGSSSKYTDLPRHPADLASPDLCVACGEDEDEENPLLACDKCDNPWHPKCLDPPLSAVPDGEWFCPACARDPGAPVGDAALLPAHAGGAHGDDAGDEDDEDMGGGRAGNGKAGSKRKGAPARGAGGARSGGAKRKK